MAGHDKEHRHPSTYLARQINEAHVHRDFTLSSAAAGSLRLAMVITVSASLAPARGNAASLSAKLAPQPRQQTLRNSEVDAEARSIYGGQIVHVQQFLHVISAYLVISHHLP